MPRAHAKQIPSISVEDEEGLCSSVMLRNRWRLDGHPEDAGLVGGQVCCRIREITSMGLALDHDRLTLGFQRLMHAIS